MDDHAANLLALLAIPHDLGQTLVEAHSNEEALVRLLHDDFAVVILDVQMHGMARSAGHAAIHRCGSTAYRFADVVFNIRP